MANQHKKTALVVSGGGAKGAFAVGVIDHLVRVENKSFDIIAGTSTGSLIAAIIAGGGQKQLRSLYSNMVTEDFLRKRNTAIAVATQNSIFDVGPFRNVLRAQMNKKRAEFVFTGKTKIFLTTVSLQTGQIVYFHAGDSGTPTRVTPPARLVEVKNRIQLLKAMEASSNQPVFMSPVKIPGIPHPPPGYPELSKSEQFVDGGVREYAPIRIALDNGATEVYAILLGPELKKKRPKNKEFTSVIEILARTLNLFSDDVGENDLANAKLIAKNNNATLHVLRPESSLPTKGLSVMKATQSKMIEMGNRAAVHGWTSFNGRPGSNDNT